MTPIGISSLMRRRLKTPSLRRLSWALKPTCQLCLHAVDDFACGGVEVVVHDEGVVRTACLGNGHLVTSLGKATFDRCLVFPRAVSEAHEQVFFGGRQDEDAKGVGHCRPHLHGALDVYVEDNDAALGEGGFDGLARCSVPESTEDLRVFEKPVLVDPTSER